MVLDSYYCEEIVCDGLEPMVDAPAKEKQTYNHICKLGISILIQTLAPEILDSIQREKNPHKLWKSLREQFYRDSPYALFAQDRKLSKLADSYSSFSSLSEFIQNFEAEYQAYLNLAKSSKDEYRVKLAELLQMDQAKRERLLGLLVDHLPNVVDNLSTKDNMTYSQVKQRLLDLGSNNSSSDLALSTTKMKGKGKAASSSSKNKSSSNKSSSSDQLVCTWCSKHSPGTKVGHTWNRCHVLKDRKEKGTWPPKDKKQEQAHVTTDNSEVSTTLFYFDTCASSHMCPDRSRFEHFTSRSGFVKSSGKTMMKIKGSGTVVLDCILRDGTVSSFRLHDVLYVPDVERALFSWGKIRNKPGFSMSAKGDIISIFKGNKVMFEAHFDGAIYKIPEYNETAFLTYEFWHEALGHMAPSTMEKARNLYANANLIPPQPENFHCPSCSLSKSTHSKPTSIETPHDQEIIHSDLCGPFPVASFGNSLYYQSFIHERSRCAFVQFYRNKSDAAQGTIDFIKEFEQQYKVDVDIFRSDGGGEFVNHTTKKFFKDKGIKHQLSPPYSPESNGLAERFNRTMGERVRAMLLPLAEILPEVYKKLWSEAVATFVYLKNRQPHKALTGMTPYELLRGSKPTIHHLQPFGRECYVHIPKAKRPAGAKLSPRAQRGIFVGYTDTIQHYRVFIPEEKRFIVSGDVFFPPFYSEGAMATMNGLPSTPVSSQPRKFPQQNLQRQPGTQSTLPIPDSEDVTFPLGRFDVEGMWYNWCERNPEAANRAYDDGIPPVCEVFYQCYQMGKRDGFLGPQFWTHDDPEPPQQQTPPPHVETENNTPRPETPLSPNQPPSHPSPQGQSREPSPDPLQSESAPNISQPPNRWQYDVQDQALRDETASIDELQLDDGNSTDSSINRNVPESPSQDIHIQDNDDQEVPEPDDLVLSAVEDMVTSVLDIPEPKTYYAALHSKESAQWQQAMDEELSSLEENEVWDEVDRPEGVKVVGGKWVLKVKGNAKGEVERFKARYVAQGYSQTLGIDYDEIFAPVARHDSLRLLLALSACRGWKIRQLDIKTAFLYGVLKEEVYMQLPEGSRKEGKVAKLKKCIYGLKQSPREWYARLAEHLRLSGFAPSTFDPCVFIHSTGKLILAVYVDDITCFGEQDTLMENSIKLLKSEFKVNDMGLLHWLLGIQIEYTDAGITLSQTAFIDKILNRFSMKDCNPVSTPIDANHRLIASLPEDIRADATLYQQIIGSLMYLTTATRPDLAYTITHLSQFNSDPSKQHLTAAKRVLRFIKGTKDRKLLYPYSSQLYLSAFSDASHGNCYDTRRSFSGYIFQLGNSTISWRSRKQRSVATSTTEAEYMAAAMTAKHLIWLQRALDELVKESIPSAMFVDNQSAIDIAHNPKVNDRSKHIDITYHFTRERIEDGSITLLHVPSVENLADICTKGLQRTSHQYLCTKIFGTK